MSDLEAGDIHEVRRLMARTRALCYATIGLVALVATMGMVSSAEESMRVNTLYARRVVIEDAPEGREVGYFEARKGSGVLMVRGKALNSGVQVSGARGDGVERTAEIALMDGTGDERITMEVTERESGPSEIKVTDPFRKETGYYPAGILLLLHEHRAGVHLYDGKGKETVTLPGVK